MRTCRARHGKHLPRGYGRIVHAWDIVILKTPRFILVLCKWRGARMNRLAGSRNRRETPRKIPDLEAAEKHFSFFSKPATIAGET